MRRIESTTTVEDLMANPKEYGVPSFAEFSRNRHKYMNKNYDDSMVALEQGPQSIRAGLRRVIYQIHYDTIDNQSDFERRLSDYGFTIADIDLTNPNPALPMKMSFVDLEPGRFDIIVNFLPEAKQ